MTPQGDKSASGLGYALGAYVLWGLLPLYFLLVLHVPPFEFVAWRIIFTLPVCLGLVFAFGRSHELARAVTSRKTLTYLATSSLLIGANWVLMITAVQTEHLLATSIGYYINPLVNIVIGTVLLGERLSRAQWIAVLLAGTGVAILLTGALSDLWISLGLALLFSFYGYVRKLAPVESLPGLTVETMMLLLPSVVVAHVYASGPTGSSMATDQGTAFALALGGVVTAAPMLLFATAARRMDYSALGFVQFLAPTLTFVLGLTVFGEPLRPAQAVCFVFIWTAIAVFSWDLLTKRRTRSRPTHL